VRPPAAAPRRRCAPPPLRPAAAVGRRCRLKAAAASACLRLARGGLCWWPACRAAKVPSARVSASGAAQPGTGELSALGPSGCLPSLATLRALTRPLCPPALGPSPGAGIRLTWHPQGDFLAVQVDKWTKTKKSTNTNFELFSIRCGAGAAAGAGAQAVRRGRRLSCGRAP
jgi:hypothetical protein